MKKLILFSALLALGIALSAQSRWAFGLDVEGGYSGQADLVEQTYPDPTFGDYYYKSETRRQPGYSGGIWAEYLLSNRFGLRLGVNYSEWRTFSEQENISYNTEEVMTSYARDRYTEKQAQLRIPLETNFYFGQPTDRTRFFLKVGVQAGYLLAQSYHTNSMYGSIGQTESYEYNYSEKTDLKAEWLDINRWQTAFIGGLGFTKEHITISLQRSWGLTKEEGGYYPYNGCCGFGSGFCDCLLPYYAPSAIRQLQQTTLRFAYRL